MCKRIGLKKANVTNYNEECLSIQDSIEIDQWCLFPLDLPKDLLHLKTIDMYAYKYDNSMIQSCSKAANPPSSWATQMPKKFQNKESEKILEYKRV